MADLYKKTMALLADTEITPAQICKDTGLGYRWLMRLIDGDYKDPGVNKIQTLHDYLTSDDAGTKSAA